VKLTDKYQATAPQKEKSRFWTTLYIHGCRTAYDHLSLISYRRELKSIRTSFELCWPLSRLNLILLPTEIPLSLCKVHTLAAYSH